MPSTTEHSESNGAADRARFSALRASARGRWDLEADRLLVETLESVRDRFTRRYKKLREDVANLEQDTQTTATELQNVLTSLLLLSHQQFVQNRVASEEEDEEANGFSSFTGPRNGDDQQRHAFGGGDMFERDAGISREIASVASLCEAVQELRIVPVARDPSEDSGESQDEEEEEHVLVGGPYRERRQMALIGTPAFLSDSYGGYYINKDGEQELPSGVSEDESEESDEAVPDSAPASTVSQINVPNRAGPPLPLLQGSGNQVARGGLTGALSQARPTNAAATKTMPSRPSTSPSSATGGQTGQTTGTRGGAATPPAPQVPAKKAAAALGATAVPAVPAPPPVGATGDSQKSGGATQPTRPATAAPEERAVAPGTADSSGSESGKKPKPKKAPLKRRPLAKRAGRGIFDSSSSSSDSSKSEPSGSKSSSTLSSSLSSSSPSSDSVSTRTPSPSANASGKTGGQPPASSATKAVPPTGEEGTEVALLPAAAAAPSKSPAVPPIKKGGQQTPTTSGLPPPPPLPPPSVKKPAPQLSNAASNPPPPPPQTHQEDDGSSDDFDLTALPPPPTVDFFEAIPIPSPTVAPEQVSPAPAPSSAAPTVESRPPPPPVTEVPRRKEDSDADDDDFLPPPPQVELPRKGQKVLSTSSDSDGEE